MKAEAADFLKKARHCLASAKGIAAAGFLDVAAGEAYFAVFHAAEAYIFERMGKAAKTHRGVRAQFGRLTQHESSIDPDLVSFLTQGYDFKVIADYGIGETVRSISAEDTNLAVSTAERFIEQVLSLLAEL